MHSSVQGNKTRKCHSFQRPKSRSNNKHDELFMMMESRQQQQKDQIDVDIKQSILEEEEEEEESSLESCPHCGYLFAFTEEGFLNCTNQKCGYLNTNIVDQGAEWRYYGAEDNQSVDPARCGLPINTLFPESSFGCQILSKGRVSYQMKQIIRYTKWQSIKYSEKTQYESFQRIIQMAQNAGIPRIIIDQALQYHKKIADSDVTFRGENRDGIIAASLYLSCRVNNYQRSPKEIAQMFHLDVKSTTKGCKNAQMIINKLEEGMEKEKKTNLNVTTPQAFIERYCTKLNIESRLTKLCQFIGMKIQQQAIMPENTPQSIAAGIVFFIATMTKSTITKRDVRVISDISEVTINKCYKKIDTNKHLIVPEVILQQYSQS